MNVRYYLNGPITSHDLSDGIYVYQMHMESLILVKANVYYTYPTTLPFPAGKTAEKAMWRSVFFLYMALHFQCRFNKNSLLQCYYLVILPAGLWSQVLEPH